MLGTDLLALSCSFKYPQARLVRIPGPAFERNRIAPKRGRFSRRLQLAPGLVPPTSWSPPPVSALDLVTR
jgi:hypothetical protein